MWPSTFKSLTQGQNACVRGFSTSSSVYRIKKYQREYPDHPNAIDCYGFTYYPRPGEVEPNIKPSRLFMVQRILSIRGQPYWIKNIIEKLKLDGDKVDKAIVINSPLVNKMLWQAKHMIKITPITFPYGEPKEGDHGYLNDNGQYILTKKIGAGIDDKRLEASIKFFEDPIRMDSDAIRKKLRDKWLTSRK